MLSVLLDGRRRRAGTLYDRVGTPVTLRVGFFYQSDPTSTGCMLTVCSSDFVLRYPPDPSNNSENRNCDQHLAQARMHARAATAGCDQCAPTAQSGGGSGRALRR